MLQAAAALCVGVGSFSDPDELPGLAHLVEHSKFTHPSGIRTIGRL